MAEYRRTLITFALGLALGIGGHMVFLYVNENGVPFLGGGNDYATIVAKEAPFGVEYDAASRRLDSITEREWDVDLYFDGPRFDRNPAMSSYAKSKGVQRRLAKLVTLPDPVEDDVLGVFTNALHPKSVSRNGLLYVIGFSRMNGPQPWMGGGFSVFTEDARQDDHVAIWAGEMAVFYSPSPGGEDMSSTIDEWARQVTSCPVTARPCEVADRYAPKDDEG